MVQFCWAARCPISRGTRHYKGWVMTIGARGRTILHAVNKPGATLLLILNILHDLSILWYQGSQGIRYIG